ncbi:MAG: hypothetical protein F6J92_22605 [Symploca sp. SIO1A3]|nr:hypothetical protein [Symploca sp. SIO1A3]
MSIIDPSSVITVSDGKTILSFKTVVASDLLTLVDRKTGQGLTSGIDASILSPGGEWRQGKVKLVLSFEEEEAGTAQED